MTHDLEVPETRAVVPGTAGRSQVLLVQSGPRSRFPIADHLAAGGFRAQVASGVAEALGELGRGGYLLCLVDLTCERAALTTIRLIRSRYPRVALAGITDVTNPVLSGEAMAAGLSDLLPWPLDPTEVALLVEHVRDCAAADPPNDPAAARRLFAQSSAMRDLVDALHDTARHQRHVCICGEPATGRSLVAATLHRLSGGESDTLITVDCAADGPQELEHHIFGLIDDAQQPVANGHPAVERLTKESAVYRALGGTLFLRTLHEAPARVQARLARLLRDREFTVDGRSVVPMNLRLVASTPPDLDQLVASGQVLAELAARITQVRLEVPPLRRRAEDIPLLAVHVAQQIALGGKAPPKCFSRSALALLAALPWHGNMTDLVTHVDTVHRSVPRQVIQLEDVLNHATLDGFATRVDTTGSLREARARFERECISAVLVRHHGRMGEAAKALGIQRTNLYRKVRQLKVSKGLLSSRR